MKEYYTFKLYHSHTYIEFKINLNYNNRVHTKTDKIRLYKVFIDI